MGGLDWGQLPFAAAYLGIADVDALVDDLLTIKTHRKPEDTEDD